MHVCACMYVCARSAYMCVRVCVQGDPHEDPPKNVYLYEMLTALMDEEEKVALQIKHSETEVPSRCHPCEYPMCMSCVCVYGSISNGTNNY